MITQIINTANTVEVVIYSILSTIFCVLALFVLVYYIRRRFKLYKEINRIPQEQMIRECYRNHLKNLKIKCIINNFIIVILVLEFLMYLGQIFMYYPYVIEYFAKEFNIHFLKELQNYSLLFYIPSYHSLVPVLSMLMDFLWLAYRKYEYKYTIIRWTWYIAIRISVVFLFEYSVVFNSISADYETIYSDFVSIIYSIFSIIDYIQFVYYARKFYLHLKSREKEIQLFYFDKKAYLDSKYLRIHFKIATILVATALFFFTLANTAGLFVILYDITYYIAIPQQWHDIIITVYNIYIYFIANPSSFISQALFIFNYLYIFIVVVYKSYIDGQKLKNINDYIKPIMKQYHDNYYNRYTNYAKLIPIFVVVVVVYIILYLY